MENKIQDYLRSEQFIGFDQFLVVQRRLDGYLAAKMGITSLAPLGFIVGLVVDSLFLAKSQSKCSRIRDRSLSAKAHKPLAQLTDNHLPLSLQRTS